jgi:hypothetical protein
MSLRDHFADQLHSNVTVTPDMEKKITYKRVWSGKLITAGEKVLYAYAVIDDKDPRLFSLLESELEELDSRFAFLSMESETIPILRPK